MRADGHVFLFFHYCIVGALTILALERSDDRSLRLLSARTALCVAAITLALYGDGQRIGIRFREYGNVLVHHVPTAVRQIFQPTVDRARFERMLAQNRVRFALPETVDRVQRSTIGFFGYQSGYLQLNGLNERPSPVAGGGPFSVFTPHLQRLNEQHVLSPATRPDYYLLKLQTIDERYVPQDDARTLNALLQSYRPLLVERGMLLLKLAPAVTPPPIRRMNEVSFRLGEEIAVSPVAPNEMLLAAFALPSSLTGSVRSALYKSAIVTLHLTAADASGVLTRRIIPSMASAPFIVSPMMESTEDLLTLYSAANGRVPQTLLVTADPAAALDSDRCSVTFYVQQRPPTLEPPALQELSEQFSYPVANRAPAKVEAANSPVKEVDGRLVQLLEPPGQIVFNLHGDERELLFDYGFDPEAYTRGTTDGADFIAELILPDGTPEQIFLSRREPRTNPADQGRHHAQLWLPVFQPGTSLRLRTTGGVRGAADWDWTFYDNIRLHRGPLNVAQFPGFRVAPSGVEGASPRMIQHENRDVLLLNAPGKLVFNLDGTERSVRFVGGLIPGAYTEGNSDGVEFTVAVQHSEGRTESVYRRWLQPKASPTDQGIQIFDVPLGVQPAGSRLIIRTSPGPHNDASWDWSYVGQVQLGQP